MEVVMEDSCTVDSNMLKPAPSILKMITPTLPRTVSARHLHSRVKPNWPVLASLNQTVHQTLLKLLPDNQSLLPSKPTDQSSTHTLEVSSTAWTVEPTLTTESSWSDMELIRELTTGSLRTHGELPGEKEDSSDSWELMLKEMLESVDSRKKLLILPFE